MFRSFPVVLCLLMVATAARGQTITVSSASLQINPSASDSYSIQGSLSGISLDGAQVVVFSVGQFGAAIPLTSFVQQSGTNVYQYNDATASTPYWLSSLTLDFDANLFTASANGIILTGLPNPFALTLGTDVAAACGVVRLQGTSPGQYQLNPADPPTQPCAIPNSPISDPPVVPAGDTGQITVTMAASGLDPGSAMLFPADDNAQPTGSSLCTFTDNGDGTLSCTASFSQPAVGPIPLLVQANVAGQPVLAPGFAIQAVAPVSDADMQQLSDVQNLLLTTGDQAYSQSGDSALSRIQILSALRQYMQAPLGLTGQPVSLSPDGNELAVFCDSGIPVTYIFGDPEDVDVTALASQQAAGGQATASVLASRFRPSATKRPSAIASRAPRPAAQPVQQCGDFDRQIIGGNQVLVWDPGQLFFGAQGDAAPYIASIFQTSKCPNFQPPVTIAGNAADTTSVEQFANFNTVIMNTHGNLDPAGRFYIVSGQPSTYDKDYWGAIGFPVPLGTACFRLLRPVVPEANPPRCYISMYDNYLGWTVSPNTIVYGGFCDGFNGTVPGKYPNGGYFPPWAEALSPWPGKFAPGPSNAFVGYNQPVTIAKNYSSGRAVFNNMLTSYSNVLNAVDDTHDPQLNVSQNGQNLAYVGNPHLELTSLTPQTGDSQVLAAFLEGTATCGQNLSGNSTDYLYVKWTNPASAGHLTAMGGMTNGSQDNFTNQANCDDSSGGCDPASVVLTPPLATPPMLVRDWALAQYTPDGTLPGNSDNIMADFYPIQNGSLTARGCLTVQGNPGLFVSGQLATVWDDSNPSARGYESFPSPPTKITQTYNVPLSDPGGVAGMGGTASVSITPMGTGSWTVTVQAGGANPNYKQDITLGSGLGPYYGLAQLGLILVNPGPAGKAKVMISGPVNNPTSTQTVGSGTLINQPGGRINITDATGKSVLQGNLDPAAPDAVASPINVSADSSCAGLTGPYCGVNIAINLSEDLLAAPMPNSASVTLNIQFVQ